MLFHSISEFSPDMIGLTGSIEQVQEACKAFRVYFSAGPKDVDMDYIVSIRNNYLQTESFFTVLVLVLVQFQSLQIIFGTRFTSGDISIEIQKMNLKNPTVIIILSFQVDHTIIIYLINADGEFVDYFGQNMDAEQISSSVAMNILKYNSMNAKWF